MEIRHRINDTKGAFFIEEQGNIRAEMTYSRWGTQKIIIDHTEVSHSLRGKGAGKQLVAAAVDYARKNNMKILPLCPFAKSVFEKVPEFRDVLS